jgi:hypothetical protein
MIVSSASRLKIYLGVFVAFIVLALFAVSFSLRGSALQAARDFEECIEALGPNPSLNQSRPSSASENDVMMMDCNARFAGRRKPGGGYSYYDFMQDRNFAIAGPNPIPEERKQIDLQYIEFLDVQRRETISTELAKRQDEQLRADLAGARQAVGPPLLLLPKNPSAAKRPVDRSKSIRCEDSPLACGWLKISAVVKDAFASSSRAKP